MKPKNQDTISAILTFVNECYIQNGYSPSVMDIANYIHCSKSNAYNYLCYLREKGLLREEKGTGCIKPSITKTEFQGIRPIPIVGEIACGTPVLADENIEGFMPLSTEYLGPGEYFILRAKGYSMVNAKIDDGDLVVVRKQSTADEGQIIVALINDEATLKRYFVDSKRKKVRLHPENDEMEDMYFDNAMIQGVAVKIIKDVK